ncbi:hypothetical protein PMAYCL1PPCAC_22119, partial [Pristionchus mayeri]
TPANLRNYAAFFLACSITDCVNLSMMIAMVVRQVIYWESSILEFHGVCSLMGDEACWVFYSILVYALCVANCLLCLSFAYRYHTIGRLAPYT